MQTNKDNIIKMAIRQKECYKMCVYTSFYLVYCDDCLSIYAMMGAIERSL